MTSIRHVLIPVDFSSESSYALRMGSDLVRFCDAHASVLHVNPYATLPESRASRGPAEPASGDIGGMLLHELWQFAEPLRRSLEPTQVIVRSGDPAREILDFVVREQVDLVVVTARPGEAPVLRRLGTVGSRLAAESPAAVLVLQCREPRLPTALSRLLCAIDLEAGAAETVEMTTSFARLLRARLTVLHVIPPTGNTSESSVQDTRRRVIALLDEARWAVPADVRTAFGTPSAEIVRIADAIGADLLVIGSHTHPPNGQPFLGRTTQAVLAHAPCAVLLARTATSRGQARPESDVFAGPMIAH